MSDGGNSQDERIRERLERYARWDKRRIGRLKRRREEFAERDDRHARGEYSQGGPDEEPPRRIPFRRSTPSPPRRPIYYGRPIHTDEEWAAGIQFNEFEYRRRVKINENLQYWEKRREDKVAAEEQAEKDKYKTSPMDQVEYLRQLAVGAPDSLQAATMYVQAKYLNGPGLYRYNIVDRLEDDPIYLRHKDLLDFQLGLGDRNWRKVRQAREASMKEWIKEVEAKNRQYALEYAKFMADKELGQQFLPPDMALALMEAPMDFGEPPIAGHDDLVVDDPSPPPSQLAGTQPLPDSEEDEESIAQPAGVAAAEVDDEASPPLHNMFQANEWTYDVITHNAVADEDYGGNYNAAGELVDDSHNFVIDEANPEESRPMTSQEIRDAKMEAIKNHIRDNGGWIDETFFFGLYPELTRFYDQYPSWRFGPDSTRPLNFGYNKVTGRFPDE